MSLKVKRSNWEDEDSNLKKLQTTPFSQVMDENTTGLQNISPKGFVI